MLSLSEEGDYTTKGLVRICQDGVDSICAGVREMEEQGYVIRRERIRNPNGQLGAIRYTILEQPHSPKRAPQSWIIQSWVLLSWKNLNWKTPAQLNTKKSSKQKSKKELSSTEGSNPTP